MAEDRQRQILVFDIGGSHIASSIFSLDSMTVGAINQASAPADGSPEDFLETLAALARNIPLDSSAASGIAVAIPNPFDYDRGISYMRHKYQQLYGVDLRHSLSTRLDFPSDRIHFLNDAAAFLIGELYQGAATGVGRAIGITLGTGVGSAFAVDGTIVVEGRGIPPGGEIWNLSYRDSIVENVISTLAIQQLYERSTGKWAEVREIASFAQAQARQTFQCFGRELGQVLRHTCLAFAPERIVFGGGISRAAELFLQTAEEELDDPSIQLRVSDLFDRAPVIGAGISWTQKFLPGNMLPSRERSGVAEGA